MKNIEIDSSKLHLENIEDIAKQKYLDYAMSVITSRALPDVRDGLKPVQRRILYSMHVLKSSSNGAYKKSARIVGDVIGKYHPHGDSSVYDAMVRMAQPFSLRMLLVDGQGNFGSVDGDSAAAMRYTEARFHKFSEQMFDDIELNTVNMQENYDGSDIEPTVLPLKMPNLLINGVQGIAVGMASNIPPHNPIEVMEAVKYIVNCYLKQEEPTIAELVKIVPAPDFPTKGLVHGTESMREAWEHGRAKMKLRSKWKEEIIDGRNVIVINEIPYQVNKERLKKKITELALANNDKDSPTYGKPEIEGIYEVIDESDKTGTRLCVYLKSGYEPEIIFNQLLKSTELEVSINYNCTVICNGEPKLFGLKDILREFITHRDEVITRRTKTLYDKNLAREVILEGLMKAVSKDNLDQVIKLIRESKEVSEARQKLIDFLDINEIQSNAILELNLRRLTGLEIKNIEEELNIRRVENIAYREILSSQTKRWEIILEESNNLIGQFEVTKEDFDRYWTNLPYSKRLTDTNCELIEYSLGSIIKEEDCALMISKDGYIRRCPIEELKEQNRGTQGNRRFDLKKNDYLKSTIDVFSHDSIMFLTKQGRAFTMKAYEITSSQAGMHINNIIPGKPKDDEIIKVVEADFDCEKEIVFVTKNGLVKRGPISEYKNSQVFKAGIRVMKIDENDEMFDSFIIDGNEDLMFFKSDNSVSRTSIDNFNIKKTRMTMGIRGTKLNADLVGVIPVKSNIEGGIVATITENGLIKLTSVEEYRETSRNSKGVKAFKENERSGKIVRAFGVSNNNVDVVVATKKGIVNRINLDSFRVTGRVSTGCKLVELGNGDEIVSVFTLIRE